MKNKKVKVKTKSLSVMDALTGTTQKFVPRKTESVSIVTITPAQARYIIKEYNNNNISNRELAFPTAQKYAQEMMSGTWKFVGDPVRFTKNRDLVDGQHRLVACALSNIPMKCSLITGLERTDFKFMDLGKRRSFADCLSMMGFKKSPSILSAVVRLIWLNDTGTLREANDGGKFTKKFTNTIGENVLRGNLEVRSYFGRYGKVPILKQKSVAVFLYWKFSQIDAKLAVVYLDKVLKGLNLVEGSQEEYLYRKLDRNAHSPCTKMPRDVIMANLIEGWRRARGISKQKSTQINWKRGNKFPEIA